jgi:hypothetical protein
MAALVRMKMTEKLGACEAVLKKVVFLQLFARVLG